MDYTAWDWVEERLSKLDQLKQKELDEVKRREAWEEIKATLRAAKTGLPRAATITDKRIVVKNISSWQVKRKPCDLEDWSGGFSLGVWMWANSKELGMSREYGGSPGVGKNITSWDELEVGD